MAPKPSEITPQAVWDGRRAFLQAALALAGGLAQAPARAQGEASNTLDEISRYNNYAEFSSNKDVVWKLAEDFRPAPWTLAVEGECEKPRTWALEDLLRRHAQEDRVYRLRCVEGWSIVVPWRGFPLARLLADARPTSRARFVEFSGVQRPAEMIGQRRPGLPWPYTEA